jgi:hypothetical protein
MESNSSEIINGKDFIMKVLNLDCNGTVYSKTNVNV